MYAMVNKIFSTELLDFINEAPTPYHAVGLMRNYLLKHGYEELYENDSWLLKKKGKYFVTRAESSIVAFTYSKDLKTGFRMVGAHTDSPCLKIKPQPVKITNGYQQLLVEVYGGVLLNPWFDRDLSLAGRVFVKSSSNKLRGYVVDFKKPLLVIPSLAIHLDRDANKQRTINSQNMIMPIIGLETSGKFSLEKLLLDQIKIEHGIKNRLEVVDYDLSLYDTQKGLFTGEKEDFIACARLDNLLSCFVGLRSLCDASESQNKLLVCNDHEEVGSNSYGGARGTFLKSILERIFNNDESFSTMMANSMLVSTDNAHGVHPNFIDKHDGNHLPILNQGPAIKVNNNQAYATSSETAAIIKQIAAKEKVNVQYFVSRNDFPCGSTIGPLTATTIGVKTVDLGVPTFAMHSIRELGGSKDPHLLYKIIRSFFGIKSVLIAGH